MTGSVRPLDLRAWQPHADAMRAYFEGDTEATVVCYDDLGGCERLPVSVFFRSPEEFLDFERPALARCRGRVLDVGAGSGCHTLFLQDQGLTVCALDVLPELVEIMRRRGVHDARIGTMDDVDGPFDTVLVMMNGFGLAESLAGLEPMLWRLRRLLAPGGRVLADSTDVRVAYGSRVTPADDRRRADGRYMGELTFQLEFAGRRGPPFPQLYVDEDTLSHHASRVGWRTEVLHRNAHGGFVVELREESTDAGATRS